jgi:hypothetical protein
MEIGLALVIIGFIASLAGNLFQSMEIDRLKHSNSKLKESNMELDHQLNLVTKKRVKKN